MTDYELVPIVLVETTEFFRSPSLNSGGWPELLARAKRQEIDLLVAEISLREENRQTREKVESALAEVRRGLGRLKERDHKTEGLLADIEEAGRAVLAEHSDRLRDGLLRHGVTVLPLPTRGIEELVQRDLDVRKPFERSGKGFRDALLWLSLIRWLSDEDEGRELFVVSDNTKDFAAPDGSSLHEDLLADLEPFCVTRAVLVRNLPDLNTAFRKHFAQPDLEREILLDVAVAEKDLRFAMTESVVAAVERLEGEDVVGRDQEWAVGLDFRDAIPNEMLHSTIDSAEADPASVEFDLHDTYDGDTYAFSARITADVSVSGYADKSDALPDDGPFDWVDLSDLTAAEIEVSVQVEAEFSFNIIAVNGTVEDVTFDSVVSAQRAVRTRLSG